MTFDFTSSIANIKDTTSSHITPGIHDATFDSIIKDTITTQDGRDLNVMSLTVVLDGGTSYKQNIFEPTSTERKDGMYGPNPSQYDHFIVTVRQILQAVNPSYADDIASGKLKLAGSFAQLVKALSDYTAQYKGAAIQVKLLPGKGGFANMPSYPARITKNGELGIATRFIGQNLTLTAAEEKKIKAAEVAKPTAMPSIGGGVDLSDLSAGLGAEIGAAADAPSSSIDDMPF